MQIIGNLDWRNPIVKHKNRIAGVVKSALALAGYWVPYSKKDRLTCYKEEIQVVGDKAPQNRRCYKIPPPASESVERLIYHPSGMAAHKGKVVERFSIRQPSVMEIIQCRSCSVKLEVEQGTVVEMETPYTYGDWVGDFICSLTSVPASEVKEPIILPKFLYDKSYVCRDLEALGYTYTSFDGPVSIKAAKVLRKRLPSYYWSPTNVRSYQSAFQVSPSTPRPGSVVYLARFDTMSESIQRQYPSRAVADYVRSIGGLVIDTRKATPKLFDDISGNVETVIADQGSALFGVMRWRTKNVIELTNKFWWHSANLFIAKGAGVVSYAVITVDDKSEPEILDNINSHLKSFTSYIESLGCDILHSEESVEV